jgi:short-subunit dehydrogenase
VAELGGVCGGMAQAGREPDGHAAVAAAAAARGDLMVWVNNAGVLHVGAAWESSDAEIRRMVDINLYGVIWGSRAAVGALADGGHLINIASLSSYVPAPGFSVYAATKHAVLGFTTSLAGDLRRAGRKLHVGAICPDAIETDMVRGVAHQAASDILFSSKQLLTAADVAAAVVAMIDRPRLVRILPASRGAAAHVFHPFPDLGLRVLERIARLGARRKAKR